MIKIHSLVYQPSETIHEPPFHFNRVSVEKVKLVANHGIEGDQKAGHNPNRQLNIMCVENTSELQTEGYKTAPGELGEQIVISGLDLQNVSEGDRLQLGKSALIEVVSHRTGCSWFEQIQGLPAKNAKGRLGVMAKVIEGGELAIGDPVKLLETERK